jgi:hypothetical protein
MQFQTTKVTKGVQRVQVLDAKRLKILWQLKVMYVKRCNVRKNSMGQIRREHLPGARNTFYEINAIGEVQHGVVTVINASLSNS